MRSCDPAKFQFKLINILAYWIKFSMESNVCESYLYLFDEFFQIFIFAVVHFFHVCKIHRIVALTIRTDVLVDSFGFALHYANTTAMEPVLTLIAAYVELCFVVWFATQTKQLLCVTRMLAFSANEFRNFF